MEKISSQMKAGLISFLVFIVLGGGFVFYIAKGNQKISSSSANPITETTSVKTPSATGATSSVTAQVRGFDRRNNKDFLSG